MFNKIHFLFIFGFIFSIISCNNFTKVMKSNDPEYKKEMADKYFEKEEYSKAQVLYEDVIATLKGVKNLENVFYRYAECQYENKDYYSSAYYFKSFVDSYIHSPLRENAMYMVAMSHYEDSPQFRLDQEATQKAIESFQLFINAYPKSDKVFDANAKIDELRKKMEKKSIAAAELYYNTEDYRAASIAFENVLKNFPESSNNERINYLIVKSNYELAKNSIEEKQLERYQKTLKSYYNFVEKYTTSKYKSELESIFDETSKQIKKIENNIKNG